MPAPTPTSTPSKRRSDPWTVQIRDHDTQIWVGVRRTHGGNGEGSILAGRFIGRRTAALYFTTVERLVARTVARYEKKAARQNARERFIHDKYAAVAAVAS